MVKFGICASVREVASLKTVPFDYLEEAVQRFLVPEQPDAPFEEQLRAASILPIPVEIANALLPADLKLIATPGLPVDTARLERYIRVTLKRAERAGIRVLVFGSGGSRACPADVEHSSALEQVGQHLATWSNWARDYGIDIVLEPLCYQETNILNTVSESGALVSHLEESGAKLLIDTYHMACNGEDPATLLPFVPLIRHVHVAEHQDRAAPGRHGEDLRPYLKSLQQGGYDQRISIECNWQQLSEEAAHALAVLKEQWREVAVEITNREGHINRFI
jgi:Sugar phosphate isomerases/epimerases